MRVIPLLVSIALHVILFMSFQVGGSSNQPHEGEKKEFADRRKPEPVRIKIQQRERSKISIPESAPKPEECPDYYVGLGYTMSENLLGWCRVLSVAPASPLDKAGVRSGDFVAHDGRECPGRGAEGSSVSVAIKKASGSVEHHILFRERICTK